MMKLPKKKSIISGAVMLLLALTLLLTAAHLPRARLDQQQAVRWAGESGMRFAQLSCFLAAGDGLQLDDIGALRQKLSEKLTENSIETPKGGALMSDAWSTGTKLNVSAERGSFDAAALAVGGSFFDFHPLRLRDGSFFAGNDLMRDRVVIDTQLAWLLYGSTELAGMTLSIDGREFVIAGVVEPERGRAAAKVATDDPMIYLPYEAYLTMNETARIDCYEIVLPDPTEDFAKALLKESFPRKDGYVLRENTGRFAFETSLNSLKNFGMMAVRREAVAYPAWENAALYTEACCALLRALALVLFIYPVVLALVLLVRLFRFVKQRLRGSGTAMVERIRDRAEDRRERKALKGKN